jgi:serine phosphatase RsbU (regulator of sigma subunit)
LIFERAKTRAFELIKEKNTQLSETQKEITAFNEELHQQKEELSATLDVVQQKNKIIHKTNEKLKSGISYASNIQLAMLPSEKNVAQFFGGKFFALSLPRDIVSGDLYWCEKVEDTILVAVADCTGHGVPGALMSMMAISELNNIVFQENILEPEKILETLHDHVYKVLRQDNRRNSDGMDIALLAYHRDRDLMEFAGAMNPVYFVKDKEINLIKGDKQPVGGYHYGRKRYFTNHEIKIDRPTVFYLASDGFQDQFGGPKNKKFGAKQFRKVLLEEHNNGFVTQKNNLLRTFETWKVQAEEKQIDDVMVVGFKVE